MDDAESFEPLVCKFGTNFLHPTTGMTAIQVACMQFSIRCLARLLKSDFTNVNEETAKAASPLVMTTSFGTKFPQRLEIVRRLLAHFTCDVNGNKPTNRFGKTFPTREKQSPLSNAVVLNDYEVCNLLMAHSNIDPNYSGVSMPPLCLAMVQAKTDLRILDLLLRHPKTDVNKEVESSGWTALHFASSGGNIKALKMIIHHPSVNFTMLTRAGETCLGVAMNDAVVDVIMARLEQL